MQPSLMSTMLRTVSAFLGVAILAATAVRSINHVANHVSTSALGSQVLQSASTAMVGRTMQPVHASSRSRIAARAQQSLLENEDVHKKDTISFTTASAALVSAAGMLGFMLIRALHQPKAIAMMVSTGSRPTLSDTKLRFLTLCDASIPNMYNIPVQELLAQHHLIRFNSKYQYDGVFALGMITVINQLLEGLPQSEVDRIEKAYFGALGDDVERFKADAAELEKWAAAAGKDLGTLSGTDDVTQKLKEVAARAVSGDFQYSKFFSIGLFQLLQQSGQTDPESFTNLVKSMSLDKERVTKDLKVYKDLLKRLEMAKDMKEKFLERERKKQQERLEKKNQAATADTTVPV